MGVHAKDLRRPSAVSFRGDTVAVAEIVGRISVLDKQGKIINVVSENLAKYKGNRWAPKEWKAGVVGSPHGITYDAQGNILMTEYNKFGRIMRFDVSEKKWCSWRSAGWPAMLACNQVAAGIFFILVGIEVCVSAS